MDLFAVPRSCCNITAAGAVAKDTKHRQSHRKLHSVAGVSEALVRKATLCNMPSAFGLIDAELTEDSIFSIGSIDRSQRTIIGSG